MTYAEKLRSPLWQKKRLQILERDRWQCFACASTTKNLQVHHVVYGKHKDPWDYADDCYQTLCEDCHESRQQIADRSANALKMVLKNLSTADMERETQRIINNHWCQDPFHHHVHAHIQEALNKGDGYFTAGLFSDVVMDLAGCMVFGKGSERAKITVRMALDVLEEAK